MCKENNSKYLIIGLFNRGLCGLTASCRSSTLNFTELGTRICQLGSPNECGMLSFPRYNTYFVFLHFLCIYAHRESLSSYHSPTCVFRSCMLGLLKRGPSFVSMSFSSHKRVQRNQKIKGRSCWGRASKTE